MIRILARVTSLAALGLACARADSSAVQTPEVQAKPAADSRPAVVRVCEHVWALLSAELDPSGERSGELEGFVRDCAINLEEERLTLGEAEFERQTTCVLEARTVETLMACEPPSEPEPKPVVEVTIPEEAVAVPLSELMELGVYTPSPDPRALQQTKAARFDKADGVSVVAFCVEPNGETANIRTVQKFPGDPMIDEIIRDTIARWRFKPMVVDGEAVEACSQRRFKLKFR